MTGPVGGSPMTAPITFEITRPTTRPIRIEDDADKRIRERRGHWGRHRHEFPVHVDAEGPGSPKLLASGMTCLRETDRHHGCSGVALSGSAGEPVSIASACA